MVLDNRVYDGLEGPWRDLFQRLKWDIVKSVLKSMTGLQGRKVKVCCLHHLGSACTTNLRNLEYSARQQGAVSESACSKRSSIG